MLRPTAEVFGRERELAAVGSFLRAVGGPSASLVLEGPAGIGKSAIWAEAVTRARSEGVVVRTCRCAAADAAWAFSGLGDLLDGIPDGVLAALPNVQRQALSAALLLDSATVVAPNDRVVAVGVLGVLRAFARSGVLLLAIDDIQWLDCASSTVLTYALRRLDDDGVRILATRRTGDAEASVADESMSGCPRGAAVSWTDQRRRLAEDCAQPSSASALAADVD